MTAPTSLPADTSPMRSVLARMVLDRSSPVPLYFQVAQHLERAIVTRELPPGTRLDNELQLAERLGLSRPTMRQAMQHLVDKGLIVRRRGAGTRVLQPKVRRPLELSSLYDDLNRGGQAPRTEVLANTVEPAGALVAEGLGLPPGALVRHIVRLRYAGESPIARLTNYLPLDLLDIPEGGLENGGLYQLLRGAGINLHSATQVIGARAATAEEARLLAESRRATLLTMHRVAYDDQGAAVEYGTHIYAAARYNFEMSLMASAR